MDARKIRYTPKVRIIRSCPSQKIKEERIRAWRKGGFRNNGYYNCSQLVLCWCKQTCAGPRSRAGVGAIDNIAGMHDAPVEDKPGSEGFCTAGRTDAKGTAISLPGNIEDQWLRL